MVKLLTSRYGLAGTLYLATPAHFAEDYGRVHSLPSPRGTHVETEGEDGATFRALPKGPMRFTLPIIVFGDRDVDGNVYADPDNGLRLNMDLMSTALDTTAAAIEFRDYLPSGGYRAADVTVEFDEVVTFGLYTLRVVTTFTVLDAAWTWTP